VNDVDVFQTVDLWEKKDIAQVVTTLFALGRTVGFISYDYLVFCTLNNFNLSNSVNYILLFFSL